MKVYELFEEEEHKFLYPEDMKAIMQYLKEHGRLIIEDKTVEQLYEKFSDEMYCASWMGVKQQKSVDYDLLKQFAEWLSEIDI